VQAYYLHALVTTAGGAITTELDDAHFAAEVRLPL
jgi:hypothetical protein